MPSSIKELMLKEVMDEFDSNSCAFFSTFQTLSVADISDFRRKAEKISKRSLLLKHTLAKKIFAAKKFNEAEKFFYNFHGLFGLLPSGFRRNSRPRGHPGFDRRSRRSRSQRSGRCSTRNRTPCHRHRWPRGSGPRWCRRPSPRRSGAAAGWCTRSGPCARRPAQTILGSRAAMRWLRC